MHSWTIPTKNVKLEKLGKTISKEFKRSPQKVIALGLMIPVAIYFWIPLVLKWTGKPAQASPVAATPVTATSNNFPNTSDNRASSVTVESSATASWESLEKWRAADRLSKSTELEEDVRNPFQFIVAVEPLPPEETEKPQEVVPAAKTPAIDPSKLSLELQATLVGGRSRRATINGRIFQEGQSMNLDGTPLKRNETGDPGKTLVVVSIRSTSVTLAANNTKFDLAIKKLGPQESDAKPASRSADDE